jgi:predicted DNA-binding transcriptional regulator YafY
MSTPATRLITLITLLQRRPNQKASDLAAELGVSVRSLHRYLQGLDEMGIPIYTERGPYGGFSLVRGYKLPPLIFTPEEAVVISLGAGLVEETWGRLYREAALSALSKLNALLPETQREEAAWARRSLVSTGLHRAILDVLPPWLEQLKQASHEGRQVEIAYQGANQNSPSTRVLDPYALVNRAGWWYVVGFCHLRKAMRNFRLDRIHELTMLETKFEVKADFDLKAYLKTESEAEKGIRVRMRFSAEMASVARSNPFTWEEVEELPDGSILAVMTAADVPWAASVALSFGPAVIVLEPEEVRQEMRRWALALVNLYS